MRNSRRPTGGGHAHDAGRVAAVARKRDVPLGPESRIGIRELPRGERTRHRPRRVDQRQRRARLRAIPSNLCDHPAAVRRQVERGVIRGHADLAERDAGAAHPAELAARSAVAGGIDERAAVRDPECRRAPGALEHRRDERRRRSGQLQRGGVEGLRDEAVLHRPQQVTGGKHRARRSRLHGGERRRGQAAGVESGRLRVLGADEHQQPAAGQQLRPAVIVVAALLVEGRQRLHAPAGRGHAIETGRPDRKHDRVVVPRAGDERHGRALVRKRAEPFDRLGADVEPPQRALGGVGQDNGCRETRTARTRRRRCLRRFAAHRCRAIGSTSVSWRTRRSRRTRSCGRRATRRPPAPSGRDPEADWRRRSRRPGAGSGTRSAWAARAEGCVRRSRRRRRRSARRLRAAGADQPLR